MRAACGCGLFAAAVDLAVFALGRLGFGGPGGFAPVGHRADETVLAEADQVLAPGLVQRLNDEPALVRPAPLQQRALQVLCMRRLGDVDRLHRARVDAGVVHARADRAGGGVKILHLLRAHVVLVKILGQIDGILQGAARVAGHEVGHQILLLAIALVEALVLADVLALVDALVLADVLALVEDLVQSDVLALVDALVLADVLALVEALVLADVLALIDALVDALVLADVLALVDALVLASTLKLSDILTDSLFS